LNLGYNNRSAFILRRYELTEPAIWIAEIIHETDLEDEHFDAPKATRSMC
jgi:hypothetical protein